MRSCGLGFACIFLFVLLQSGAAQTFSTEYLEEPTAEEHAIDFEFYSRLDAHLKRAKAMQADSAETDAIRKEFLERLAKAGIEEQTDLRFALQYWDSVLLKLAMERKQGTLFHRLDDLPEQTAVSFRGFKLKNGDVLFFQTRDIGKFAFIQGLVEPDQSLRSVGVLVFSESDKTNRSVLPLVYFPDDENGQTRVLPLTQVLSSQFAEYVEVYRQVEQTQKTAKQIENYFKQDEPQRFFDALPGAWLSRFFGFLGKKNQIVAQVTPAFKRNLETLGFDNEGTDLPEHFVLNELVSEYLVPVAVYDSGSFERNVITQVLLQDFSTRFNQGDLILDPYELKRYRQIQRAFSDSFFEKIVRAFRLAVDKEMKDEPTTLRASIKAEESIFVFSRFKANRFVEDGSRRSFPARDDLLAAEGIDVFPGEQREALRAVEEILNPSFLDLFRTDPAMVEAAEILRVAFVRQPGDVRFEFRFETLRAILQILGRYDTHPYLRYSALRALQLYLIPRLIEGEDHDESFLLSMQVRKYLSGEMTPKRSTAIAVAKWVLFRSIAGEQFYPPDPNPLLRKMAAKVYVLLDKTNSYARPLAHEKFAFEDIRPTWGRYKESSDPKDVLLLLDFFLMTGVNPPENDFYVRSIYSENKLVRVKAVQGLRRTGQINLLKIRGFSDLDPWVRKDCLIALNSIPGALTPDDLARFLADPDFEVVATARQCQTTSKN